MRGPYMHYVSDFPNQVHQLNLSISQNHHILKTGEIKYQIKKFDVNWKNYQNTGKRHIVNILIRDHFSNCFYAEIFPIDEMPHIKDFLYKAWGHKENYEFCGIPKNLIIGRHILEMFPEIANLSHNAKINIALARNGFATGIRSMRDWESNIRHFTYYYKDLKYIKHFQRNTELICRDLNTRDCGKTELNLLKWQNNDPQGEIIDDLSLFYNLFLPSK